MEKVSNNNNNTFNITCQDILTISDKFYTVDEYYRVLATFTKSEIATLKLLFNMRTCESIYPTQETIAKKTGYKRRTIQRAIKKFKELGLLNTLYRYKLSNKYFFPEFIMTQAYIKAAAVFFGIILKFSLILLASKSIPKPDVALLILNNEISYIKSLPFGQSFNITDRNDIKKRTESMQAQLLEDYLLMTDLTQQEKNEFQQESVEILSQALLKLAKQKQKTAINKVGPYLRSIINELKAKQTAKQSYNKKSTESVKAVINPTRYPTAQELQQRKMDYAEANGFDGKGEFISNGEKIEMIARHKIHGKWITNREMKAMNEAHGVFKQLDERFSGTRGTVKRLDSVIAGLLEQAKPTNSSQYPIDGSIITPKREKADQPLRPVDIVQEYMNINTPYTNEDGQGETIWEEII